MCLIDFEPNYHFMIKSILTIDKRVILLAFIIITGALSSCRQFKKEAQEKEDKNVTQTKEINPWDSLSLPVSIDFDSIRQKGKLVAIVDNTSTSYFLYKGQPMGFEYELLSMLANYLEVELEIIINTDILESAAMLNSGQGDIIAHNLTVLKSRKKALNFTQPQYYVKQVLVQRKPEGWPTMKRHQLDAKLIRNPIQLIGKEVHVKKNSSYKKRLMNLSEEIGGNIIITEENDDIPTETLIRWVSEGKIPYTIADNDVANLNATYYSNLDTETEISFPQQIAWAVRKNSPQLLEKVNEWLKNVKQRPAYNVIYNKYFQSPKWLKHRNKSDYSSLAGTRISPYDDLIKKGAEKIGWDWKLLAALIYRESKFNPQAESWAGAVGLMQLLPETGELYGAEDLTDPAQNIEAGTRYLKWLDELWQERIPDQEERIKFILASYNVGQGHVLDAYRLAKKYDKNHRLWKDNVEYFLIRKCNEEYFDDPVVETGYCRGDEPVNYVRIIMKRFEQYQQLLTS